MKKFAIALALASLLTASAYAQGPKPAPPGPTDPLTILSGGKSHVFQVELADTPEESELGLMYRKEMARDRGMIFHFGKPTQTGMWMKNCVFPQDMLFLDADGAVLAIAENARPGSERIITPGFPFTGVLELNGGVVKELGLKPGDRIQHKMFKAVAGRGG